MCSVSPVMTGGQRASRSVVDVAGTVCLHPHSLWRHHFVVDRGMLSRAMVRRDAVVRLLSAYAHPIVTAVLIYPSEGAVER